VCWLYQVVTLPHAVLPAWAPPGSSSFRARFQHLLLPPRCQFLHHYDQIDALVILIHVACRVTQSSLSHAVLPVWAPSGSSRFRARFQHLPPPPRSQFLHRCDQVDVLVILIHVACWLYQVVTFPHAVLLRGLRQEARASGHDFNTFRCRHGNNSRTCPPPTVSGSFLHFMATGSHFAETYGQRRDHASPWATLLVMTQRVKLFLSFFLLLSLMILRLATI